jgi:hypothetical protein
VNWQAFLPYNVNMSGPVVHLTANHLFS